MGEELYAFEHVCYILSLYREVKDFWNDVWVTAPFTEDDLFRGHLEANSEYLYLNGEFITSPDSPTHTISAWWGGATRRLNRGSRIYIPATPDLLSDEDEDGMLEFMWRSFDIVNFSRPETNRRVVEISVREREVDYSEQRQAWLNYAGYDSGVVRSAPRIDNEDGIDTDEVLQSDQPEGFESDSVPIQTIPFFPPQEQDRYWV